MLWNYFIILFCYFLKLFAAALISIPFFLNIYLSCREILVLLHTITRPMRQVAMVDS